ncbi:hypothetical protein [Alkalibacillus salilacus]|uniref:ParB/Sulfiredoxin domain-containing protein n=1 Tax=Alkalibacillus salilacus TaxID=284582 RepID=A0ABT9VFC9_9BACI|nr:hypothetical protein [Alkalibacillus salilacus]MDQ0159604.1 hypothetical protein [Alkalibacillus salilacus]
MANPTNPKEEAAQHFNPVDHITSRIHEMKQTSEYGARLSFEWWRLLNQNLKNCQYPVVHPKGQETFSLYITFSTGLFECALSIDGVTSFIKENGIKPVKYSPTDIISAVDQGNINQDPNLIKPNHKNPVMVLQSYYFTENKPYCINGNHRIHEAFLKNDHGIDVYLLEDLVFPNLFHNTICKAIYFLEIDYNNVMTDKRHYLQDDNDAIVYRLN